MRGVGYTIAWRGKQTFYLGFFCQGRRRRRTGLAGLGMDGMGRLICLGPPRSSRVGRKMGRELAIEQPRRQQHAYRRHPDDEGLRLS